MTPEQLLLALDDAVNRADAPRVEELIGLGVDVNGRDCWGDTPLMSAAWVGAVEVIDLLIQNGADVNAIGANQQTVLDRARLREQSDWNYAEVIRALEAAGAVASQHPN